MQTCKGTFELPQAHRHVDVKPGTLITDAAILADVVLNVKCGNVGSCGGCAVDLVKGTFRRGNETIELAGDGATRRVLGCQTAIESNDWLVRVPRRSLVEAGERVVVDFDIRTEFALRPTAQAFCVEMDKPTLDDAAGDVERLARHLAADHHVDAAAPSLRALRRLPEVVDEGDFTVTATVADVDGRSCLVDVRPGDAARRTFGLAVDIGTTTVALEVVDLVNGQCVGAASSYNQQVARADDVASRISICQSGGQKGVAELQHLIIEETINRLTRTVCVKHGIHPHEIVRVSVSANTTMTLLALGVSPAHVGVLPFQPATNRPVPYTAGELGLAVNPAALVDAVPGFHGYVGGDITSDIIVSGLAERDDLALLIDIGTNGEMALGNRDGIVACSCAAGPAFEGGKIRWGMRASTGAIDTIRIERACLEAGWTTINNEPPHGICGSALIDFLAEGLRTGLVNLAGRFDASPADCAVLDTVQDERGNDVVRYVLVPAEATEEGREPITISEKDVQELLQAKAAIFSGVRLLLAAAGKTIDDLSAIFLAGGFAKHINLANAIAMGLLPDVPLARIHVVGNGSLAGAYLRLIDRQIAGRMAELVSRPRVIELNKQPGFMDEFTNALFLPHMDPTLFPSAAS